MPVIYIILLIGAVAFIIFYFMSFKKLCKLKREIHITNDELHIQSKKIEELNNELNSLSYSISHDLRTPIRAINGFSRIFQKEFGSKLNKEGNELLNIISDNIKILNKQIESILLYSRIVRRDMKFTNINIKIMINEIFQEMIEREPERKIDLILKEIPDVWGDRSMIRQLWINLLSNSIKFTQLKSIAVIEIGGYENKNENVFYIKDNGIGFDIKYADKAFNLFQRLHTSKEFEGIGAGLAIVKIIVQRHDGNISVDSALDIGFLSP
jgi:two-component system sensor kinase